MEDPTEVIDPVDDYDEYDEVDYEYDEDEGDEDEPQPARRKQGAGAFAVKAAAELMITLGLVVLLFAVYEVWITDLISAGKQDNVTVALDDQWQDHPERGQKFEFADGEGMAKLYIPALGADYRFTVVEGTSVRNLETGPAHYKSSALPGKPGNFSVAGHRVGKGAPFNDLDLVTSCDAIVVETQTAWHVYRMLPTAADAKDWAAHESNPKCAGVKPLTGEYGKAVGQQIVTPKQSDVVAPVPGNPTSTVPEAERLKLLTLTTCHPRFSNEKRLIVQAILVREQVKDPADKQALPVELKETA